MTNLEKLGIRTLLNNVIEAREEYHKANNLSIPESKRDDAWCNALELIEGVIDNLKFVLEEDRKSLSK